MSRNGTVKTGFKNASQAYGEGDLRADADLQTDSLPATRSWGGAFSDLTRVITDLLLIGRNDDAKHRAACLQTLYPLPSLRSQPVSENHRGPRSSPYFWNQRRHTSNRSPRCLRYELAWFSQHDHPGSVQLRTHRSGRQWRVTAYPAQSCEHLGPHGGIDGYAPGAPAGSRRAGSCRGRAQATCQSGRR